MKIARIAAALLCILVFSGCSRMYDGSYTSVTPHSVPSEAPATQEKHAAKDRDELYAVVEKLVHNGLTGAVIDVATYDPSRLEEDAQWVNGAVLKYDPIAAYAVEKISFDRQTRESKAVLAVTVKYRNDRSQVRLIQYVNNTQTAAAVVRQALDRCEERLVMYIHDYSPMDFGKIVEDYARTMPQMVMECPRVTVGIFPEQGMTRVVELKLSYRTDRATLLQMQEEVQTVFESAKLYVSGSEEPVQLYEQLGAFLMSRYDYQVDSTATPAYDLLCQGIGDSRAFASVYAAMCKQSGMECIVVSGEKNGQSYVWNMVCVDGEYYHVDLMEPEFRFCTDRQMSGYAWDFEKFPACGGVLIERSGE